MGGRRSNGEGSIICDKRRKKPYRARVTVGFEFDEETGTNKQIIKDLGSYKTKGEAAKALADYFSTPYDLDKKDITFSQLYDEWFEDFLADGHESNRYQVKAAYRYCTQLYDKKMRDITIRDMKECINTGYVVVPRGKDKGQIQKASPQTKESIKYLFNHMFDYAVEARLVEHNYAREFALSKSVEHEKERNRKVKIPFSAEEMDKLWTSIEFVPFADMIVYACYSGWRPSELVKLKVADVDLDVGVIKGGIKTESGRGRLVPIHSLVRPIVEKYYNEAVSVGSKYLFNDITKKSGIGLSYDQYLSRFNNVIGTLKFRSEITPHYTRTTFITMAKLRNVDMNDAILKLIVGHRIEDLTERVYTYRRIEDLKAEMEKIKRDSLHIYDEEMSQDDRIYVH